MINITIFVPVKTMNMDNKKDFDVYEECEKCNRSAKKWLKKALWSFIVCILSVALYFLQVPGSTLWSWIFGLSLIYFIVSLAMAYSRWTDQMKYANWGGWF